MNLRSAALGLSFLALVISAKADSITVPNFSFENSYYSGNEATSTGIVDWTYANGDGGAYYGTQSNDGQFNNTGSDSAPQYGVFVGDQYAFMNMVDNGSATLTSASSLATIQLGTTYTLTVGIGNHTEPDDVDYGQPGNQSISLFANGTVIPLATLTVPNGTLANGVNADYTVSFTASGAYAGLAGDALTIQLADNADGVGRPVQAAFDDVRLLETPEPSTWAMMFVSIALLSAAIRSRRLV